MQEEAEEEQESLKALLSAAVAKLSLVSSTFLYVNMFFLVMIICTKDVTVVP